jgi:hypothetical protein
MWEPFRVLFLRCNRVHPRHWMGIVSSDSAQAITSLVTGVEEDLLDRHRAHRF